MRGQFTFYRSFLDGIEEFESNEEKLQAFLSVARYALDGMEPDIETMSPMLRMFWKVVRPFLKSGTKKAENAKQREAEKTILQRASELILSEQGQGESPYKEQEIEQEIDKDKVKDKDKVLEQMLYTPQSPPEGEESGFSEFWEVYPKKRSKGAAWKAWKKINPDEHLLAMIVASVCDHIARDASWAKDNGQYIPYPATYLNGHMWDDAIVETPRKKTEYDEWLEA